MSHNDSSDRFIVLKPYSIKELADKYGVTPKTFRKWLAPFKEEIGPRIGWFYSVRQIKIIFKRLSYPSELDPEEEA